jgi:hypothetical protein
MAKSNTITNICEWTWLPVSVLETVEGQYPSLIIQTPTGKRSVDLKEKHIPFIFGSVTQTDKGAVDLIDEIKKIERGADDYLRGEWLKSKK